MAEVMKPGSNDAVSIRNIPASKKDREELNKAFREQKAIEQKHKEERFSAIRARRKNKTGGAGINIEVTGDPS